MKTRVLWLLKESLWLSFYVFLHLRALLLTTLLNPLEETKYALFHFQ